MTPEEGTVLALCTELSHLNGVKYEESRHLSKLKEEFPENWVL